MKIAKVPQPWASLVMTEAIEYILPIGDIGKDEIILIYAVRMIDERYKTAINCVNLEELEYNDVTLGNIAYPLPTDCAIGWVKVADFNPRKRDKLYVTDVHQFVDPIKINIAQIDSSILNKQCKEQNYHTIEFGHLKFPNKIQKGKYFYTDAVILPLGDEAWRKFVFEKDSIYLYWSEEFLPLTSWIASKFDNFETSDAQISVILRHEDKDIWCMMLNREEVCRDSFPYYETDEKTGKKTWKGTIDCLLFNFDKTLGLEIDSLDGLNIIDEEKKRLSSKEKEDKQKHREWVNIIYTPMGNKR